MAERETGSFAVICPHCKVEVFPVPEMLDEIGYKRANGRDRFFEGRGCERCSQTGFIGRVGIYELMVTGDSIRDMVVQRVNSSVIRNQAIKEGMLTLRQDGWRKVLTGTTTIDEVARTTAGDIS